MAEMQSKAETLKITSLCMFLREFILGPDIKIIM